MLKRCQVQLTKSHIDTRLSPADVQFLPQVQRLGKERIRFEKTSGQNNIVNHKDMHKDVRLIDMKSVLPLKLLTCEHQRLFPVATFQIPVIQIGTQDRDLVDTVSSRHRGAVDFF
jgi:hypothetical protein